MVRSLGALMIVLLTAAGASAQSPARAPEQKRPSLLVPLYASQAVLNGLDVHSTMTALRAGNVEGNPVMRGLTPKQMLGMKAASSASTILITEKLWRRHRAAAVGLMVASNVSLAVIAARNYRIAER
jgi:hypothetical protein